MDLQYEANRWYQLDMLLDWDNQEIALFIDGQFKITISFYSSMRDEVKISGDKNCPTRNFINMLSLYTLSPGV